MKPNAYSFRRLARPALLLGVALGLAPAVLNSAASAQTGPLPQSPAQPTPYQAPLYHNGGAQDPITSAPVTGVTPSLFDGRLQGTPTGVGKDGTTPTQIPSYLLGAYNPGLPPGAANVYYPEHFADGTIYQWASPFDYVSQAAQQITVDDTDTVNFAQTNFVQITGTPVAALATGGEYYRLPAGTNGSATWTLTANTAGSYSVYFHIPDNIVDTTLTPPAAEVRSTAVTYTITTSGSSSTTTTATVSQTEANALQLLGGPLSLAAGDVVTVTLQRTNRVNTAPTVLIADSMTLQPAVGDVQSAPTAINRSAFPNDFNGFQYWGVYVPGANVLPGGSATLTGIAAVQANATPDTVTGTPGGPILIHSGNPANIQDNTGTPLPAGTAQPRLIRQVVYFGRSEPTAAYSTTVDNGTNGFIGSGGGAVITDASATNGNYARYAATAQPGYPVARWNLTAPQSGQYFLSVHLPSNFQNTTTRTAAPDSRVPDATYTVSYASGGTTVTRTATLSQVAGGDFALSVGGVGLTQGQTVTVSLLGGTASGVTNPQVVADSVTLSTGGRRGAIYCVDGFNGEVIWRYETPSSPRGASAPVFSSPAVARIHVLVPTPSGGTAPTYANKLVVIVGDNNGLVYCLDAVGYGDGTSNAQVIDPNTGQPITIAQPLYGTTTPPAPIAAGTLATAVSAHVGTTSAYWIYRPDPNLPKKLNAAEAPAAVAVGAVRRASPTAAVHLYDRDLPSPGAFGTASPNVFVDPSVTDVTVNNAYVYLPNSNGVVYALNALGVPVAEDATTGNETGGDAFNNSADVSASQGLVPTPTTRWWFTLRGVAGASGTGNSAASFTSAAALYVATTTTAATTPGGTATTTYAPTVYVGSSNEEGDPSNVGRVYALDGLLGPAGNGGKTPASAAAPGSPNYNLSQRPQTAKADTLHWSFPDAYGTDAYGTGQSSNALARPALGNVTGSPVVFTDPNETDTARQTRVYFAANSGLEVPAGSSTGTAASARPDDTATGRVWAVNLDGSVGSTTRAGAVPNTGSANDNNAGVWAYPLANDPNNAGKDRVAEPQNPIGSFLRATPALGVVQFPSVIQYAGGTANYTHSDVVRTGGIRGQSVPMLYVATRGANDTALYALDIDGDQTQDTATTVTTTGRLIYRQGSPDGTIFQSSPALVTNATTSGGNGGAVFAVAGNTLYDFSATPITNSDPVATDAAAQFPLVREDAAFTGFGPISSPSLAAADVSDLTPNTFTLYPTNVTDWVYVGDSTTGLCRAITPQDSSDAAIPPGLAEIVPFTPDAVIPTDLNAFAQTYLVDAAHAGSTRAAPGADALLTGATAALPVYEWGQDVYVRIKNIAPPTGTTNGNGVAFVYDTTQTPSAQNPVTAYYGGGDVTFELSDPSAGGVADTGLVPATPVKAPPGNLTTPLGIGFFRRTDTDAASNLVDPNAANKGYIAAYTYHISDGSARLNTPGSQRRILNVRQVVHVGTFDGAVLTTTGRTTTLSGQVSSGNVVTRSVNGQNTLAYVPPVDQPTFGILNPIGVRGGGVPLSLSSTTATAAVPVGDDLGPFRGVASPMAANPDPYDLQALANGNSVPPAAPPSTGGGGLSPIARPAGDLNTTLANTGPRVVVTSTGLIPHNSGGDNADPTASQNVPSGTGVTNSGLPANANFGTVGLPYALDVFDRSALFYAGQRLRIRMNASPDGGPGGGLAWNDNTVLTTQGNTTGHDSVVNYLPWETAPLGVRAGPNTSPDYPDISAGNIAATLYSVDGASSLSGDVSTPTPGVGGSGTDPVLTRRVYGSPVQVHVTVPPHQPANQQVYIDQTSGTGVTSGVRYSASGETVPAALTSGAQAFPMGYYATRRIFVPNGTGRYIAGAAYRDVRVYTGVPVDMSTSIVNPTTDVGRIPSALGVQTDPFAPLGEFTPVNPHFGGFFQPITVHNDGNVNLLNVHLDQKQFYPPTGQAAQGTFHNLELFSDSLDPLSFIPGFDTQGITGPRGNVSGVAATIPQQPYLLRSSLDTDLVDAYGRNPALYANAGRFYPGATFHKPLPGSASPSTLTVPDVPSDTSSGYALPAGDRPSLLDATGRSTGRPTIAAPPFVSLAVPFGTPVGTYAQTVRAFEGLDTTGYKTYNGSDYNPLYPPQYGGAVGGVGRPAVNAGGNVANGDIYQYGLQPVSTTGTVVKGTVTEDRLTDGYTYGALPQVDNPGAGAAGVPDFGPAAFRDPASGWLSVFWTSSQGRAAAAGVSPFDVYGFNVNFDRTFGTAGAFLANASRGSWWSPISGADGKIFSDAAGQPTHSGLTVAQGGGSAYAFDVAVGAGPYSNTLYAYPVTPSTGAIGTGTAITNDPSQVKYGVKGLVTSGFTNTLWAFWTASTRGRTAIYYNTANAATTALLPIPAGLTAVSDPCPVLLPALAAGGTGTIEVTFSGTAPDGSVDLYDCRYVPDSANAAKLNIVSFAAVREILAPVGGGYQARDAAWDRTGQLNLFAMDTTRQPGTTGYETPLLYSGPNTALVPQFSRAVFDRASGQLVLSGLTMPGGTAGGTTAYLDGATGRVRFAPALTPAQAGRYRIEALFVPQARRITGAVGDKRADTGPVSFLDGAYKLNDTPTLAPVPADRRWYLWRKSAAGQGSAATLFFKTQRLTAFLPAPVDTTKPITVTLGGQTYTGVYDLRNVPNGPNPSARLFFPIASGAEGQAFSVTYTPLGATATVTVGDVVQWQDERRSSDTSVPPANTAQGLQSAEGYAVPLNRTVNENNVAAFLDPDAFRNTSNAVTFPHKVWLFWNSTRNGTADLYSETIDPRFGP